MARNTHAEVLDLLKSSLRSAHQTLDDLLLFLRHRGNSTAAERELIREHASGVKELLEQFADGQPSNSLESIVAMLARADPAHSDQFDRVIQGCSMPDRGDLCWPVFGPCRAAPAPLTTHFY